MSKARFVLLFAVVVASIGAAPPTAAALVGTFNCVTHGGSATYHFHSENHPWGAWVRADTTFPAQSGKPASSASTFVGYDSDAKQWNIVSIDRAGSYYTRMSNSPEFSGSHWTDEYPADGGRAVITVTSQRYTFDLTTPDKGRSSTSHTVCTRA